MEDGGTVSRTIDEKLNFYAGERSMDGSWVGFWNCWQKLEKLGVSGWVLPLMNRGSAPARLARYQKQLAGF